MAPVYSRPGRGPTSIAGIVISGPEYLTVFDGQTGAAKSTIDYVPPRYPGKIKPTTEELTSVWGSGMGNNDGRFGACIAYLDGVHPSVVMTRGIYTRIVLAAFDWKDGKLVQRWVFDSDVPGMGKDGKFNIAYAGQGNHSLTVADVNHDGKDEIVYGACALITTARGFTRRAWGMAMPSMSARSIPTARTCKSSTSMRFRRIPGARNCMTPPPANLSGAIREK